MGVRRPGCVIVVLATAVAALFPPAALAHTTARSTPPPVPSTVAGTTARSTPTTARAEHVVVPGDTLTGIARRYGVDPDEVAAMNDLRHRDLVKVGQHLKVPGIAAPDTLPARLLARPERVALLPRFVHWAQRNDIPADLLMATTWLESGWNNAKISSAGAIGIGQLMPDTARFVARDLIGIELDPHEPEHNIRMSARFLRFLLKQTRGDVTLALYGYYQGLRSVAQNGVYVDTRRYAADVQALRALFKVGGTGPAVAGTGTTQPQQATATSTSPTSRPPTKTAPTTKASTERSAGRSPVTAPPTTRVQARAARRGATATRVQVRADLASSQGDATSGGQRA